MRVFVKGDIHGMTQKLKEFCEQNKLTREDVIILLGDTGINYFGSFGEIWKDKGLKKRLANIPVTFFIINGNHDNKPQNTGLYKDSVFFDNEVYVEDEFPSLILAKDGLIYNINGSKTFVCGGAYSVDKYYRLSTGRNWFADEQPSDETKLLSESNLEDASWKVDYVITHTCPIGFEPTELFLSNLDQSTVDKTTEIWLRKIEMNLDYKHWYFGHFHGDRDINYKCSILFQEFLELGRHFSDVDTNQKNI